MDISGQNMVINGKFEMPFFKDTCHSVYMNYDIPYLPHWYRCYNSSMYYLNPSRNVYICGAIWDKTKHLKPFEGQGFISSIEDFRFDAQKNMILSSRAGYPVGSVIEYGIYQKLTQTLKKDSWYIISYRYQMGFDKDEDSSGGINWDNGFYRALISNFGVMFVTDTPPLVIDYFRRKEENYDPYLQDTILDTTFKWRLIERVYKADSNYNYIILSRFTNITKSKYRLNKDSFKPGWSPFFVNQIDDVRLLSIDKYIRTNDDTILCLPDNVQLKVLSGLGPFKWRRANDPSNILSNTSILIAKVDSTTLFQVMSPYDTASIMVYLHKPVYDSINISSCGSYLWRGKLRSTTGVYKDTVNTGSCMSYYTLYYKRILNNKVTILDSNYLKADQDSVSYQWFSCNPFTKLDGETKRTIKVSKDKSYAVVLNNGKGCIDTSDCIELYSSQLSVVRGQQVWSVFPNPFSNEITIDLGKTYKTISIKVYDLTGRLISNHEQTKLSTFNFQLSTAPKGIYYLQIETETQNQFFNIRKE